MNIFWAVFIAALALAAWPYPESCCKGAVEVECHDGRETMDDGRWMRELTIITKAAERNNCRGDDFLILLAICRAENGGPGREFGIKHRLCRAAIKREPQRSLDIQAGWAAATIVKNRKRWTRDGRRETSDFIDYLGDKYCPASADPQGNINWKINVKYFYEKFTRDNE